MKCDFLAKFKQQGNQVGLVFSMCDYSVGEPFIAGIVEPKTIVLPGVSIVANENDRVVLRPSVRLFFIRGFLQLYIFMTKYPFGGDGMPDRLAIYNTAKNPISCQPIKKGISSASFLSQHDSRRDNQQYGVENF